MNTVGIYTITSPSNKVYIGQSMNVLERWKRHSRRKAMHPLCQSISKYGAKNHLFELVYELPKDVSKPTLTAYEQFFIDQYKEAGHELMNLSDCAVPAKNRVVTSETKLKISIAQKGKKSGKVISAGEREKINEGIRKRYAQGNPGPRKGIKSTKPAWNKGLTTSDEVKAKQSIAATLRGPNNIGYKHSEETKAIIKAKRALQTNVRNGRSKKKEL